MIEPIPVSDKRANIIAEREYGAAMADSTDHSLSRATLWAALIGGICVITSALIGVSVGHRRADDAVQDLQKDVRSREQSLDSLNSELAKRDAQISDLKASMEAQQRLAAELQQELVRLKTGSASSTAQTSLDGRSGTVSGAEPVRPDIRSTPQRLEEGDFNFELRSCTRRGGLVRCSLAVTNVAGSSKKINLCSSYLVDEAGRQPDTRVQFDGGACGIFSLEPSLPRALYMSATIPSDARKLNVVLRDGSWFSFSGAVIFRDVLVQ